ncbi:MAG: alpha/beta hydrolase [Planctomycetes bacterium]|nr:alpha/beta hydrolase [Planctomycetota bacterium]MCH9726151.1 alpha/beta hydrolase [Planctomycetota bacterium]MCH9775657.1 alpha/beta hydrolase [Planctomycetota bacterium]MCH9792035.1 alpha/beta hydrolase [Planctomycetota bacterium]
MKYLTLIVLWSGLFQSSSLFAFPPSKTKIPTPPADIIFERDIPYREGHERWVLNVIRPKADSTQPRAAIVLVHGGGWTGGDHYRFSKMGFQLAQAGYVVITPTYRMLQDKPFPACLHDVKNSIRWLRAHAKKYNVDPDKIGAYGNSAGGTLVLTAALTKKQDFEGKGSHQNVSSELQAVVCSGAVGNMLHPNHSKRAAFVYRKLAIGKNRKLPDNEIKKIMRQASPSSYVRKDVCPIILVHGAKDKVVFIDSTDEFFKAMQKVGADINYLRFEDGSHGVMGQKGAKTMPAMLQFFEKHLNQAPHHQK